MGTHKKKTVKKYKKGKKELQAWKWKQRCKDCGTSENLTIHHDPPKRDYDMWPEEIREIVVLCKKCHKEEHRGEGYS